MKHKENILKLREEGKSYKQIQEILGCSKGTIAYHLGSGQKEKTHKRTRDLRSINTKKLRELKENVGCVDCKEMYPHYVLEFDHRPGEKKIDVVYRVLKNFGIEMAWIEVAKCDVVCSNCHKVRTYSREHYES
jgi:transposase